MPVTTINVDAVNYQRNGVSGRGFFTVDFRTRWKGGRKMDRLIAIVPSPATDAEGNDTTKLDDEYGVECFVIDPDNIGFGFRGDSFAPAVRKAIADYRNDEGSAKWGELSKKVFRA